MRADGPLDFLRDEQNREALRLLGTALVAFVLAAWALFQEFRNRRRLREIDAEIAQMKAGQADILRMLERTEYRHDLLFGYAMGMVALRPDAKPTDESPADDV